MRGLKTYTINIQSNFGHKNPKLLSMQVRSIHIFVVIVLWKKWTSEVPIIQAINNVGETTLLVSEIYLVSAIGPLSFKWVILVPKVSIMSIVSPLLTAVSIIVYLANEIMTWHLFNWFGTVSHQQLKKINRSYFR